MMHKSLSLLALSLSLAACTSSSAQETAMNEAPLSWLTGCWAHMNGSTQETWTQSYDGLLFGHSITMREGRTVAFEDIRIEPRNEGLTYIVSVNGVDGVVFSEADQSETDITFENPTHDFPQRITYQRSDDNLTATISLLDDQNAISFNMQDCRKAPPD